jgi:hypothetical protein
MLRTVNDDLIVDLDLFELLVWPQVLTGQASTDCLPYDYTNTKYIGFCAIFFTKVHFGSTTK